MTTGTSYTIFYRNHEGAVLDIIRDFMSLEYTLTENDYGSLYIDLPPIYNKDFFMIDGRLEISRSVSYGNNTIEGDKPYFIRLVRDKYDDDGKHYLHILAYDALHLIHRRIISYPSNTPYTKKSGAADSILVALFRENCGDLISNVDNLPAVLAQRAFPAYAQHYGTPSGSGSSIQTDDMSRLLLLPRMQEIANESSEAGHYLAFDFVRNDDVGLKFMTYLGQRGANHGSGSPSQLKFSIHNQDLSYSSVEWDHTETRNFIYAGGRGESNNRLVETEADYERIKISPFNRIEDWIDVDTENQQEAADEAAATVRNRAPRQIFNGHISQTPDCMYGIHYKWGDLVTAVQDDVAIDVHLSTVNVRVTADADEEITVYARNYQSGEY